MTIKQQPNGKYLPKWRDLVAKGRARKRAGRSKRGILSVKLALENLKLPHCQEISFWNPFHRGKHGDLDGGLQWVDFVVRKKGRRPFVVILDDPQKRKKEYEKMYYSNKLMGLSDRGISFIVLPAGLSGQEYQIMIFMGMKKGV